MNTEKLVKKVNKHDNDIIKVNEQLDNIAIKIDKRLAVEVDDTARLQRAIDNATSVKTLLISEEFVITSLKLKDNIYIKQNGGFKGRMKIIKISLNKKRTLYKLIKRKW